MKFVKFYKNSCPHCKVFDPLYAKMKEKYQSEAEFYEVNLDEAPQYKKIFKMKFVPSVYQFESEDFIEVKNIKKIDIGHSKDNYPLFEESLENMIKSDE